MQSIEISIRIHSLTGQLILEARRGNEKLWEIPTDIRADQLADLRRTFGLFLQKAKDALGFDLEPPWENVSAFLKQLYLGSNYLLAKIFPRNAQPSAQRWQDSIGNLLEPTEPLAITLTAPETSSVPGRQPNLLLPLEFLPLFRIISNRPEPPPDVTSREDLVKALSDYVGYRCIVNRVLPISGDQVPRKSETADLLELDTATKLAGKLFICRTLAGAEREEQRLSEVLQCSSWPFHGVRGTAAELAEFLWRTTHSINGEENLRPDQIHHFASHFDTTPDHPDHHVITLAGCSDTQFEVALMELEANLGAWAFGGAPPERERRPLVFVNACGSSKVSPQGISSLPGLFLGPLLSSRGFIGTETTMSDSVAAEFAAEFYTRLIRGAPVGRAMHDARHAIIVKFSNPLGFFYTCYAHPSLRVVN